MAKEPRLDSAKLERTVELINAAVPDCLVTGYGHLIDDVSLPYPDDWHVLAAAIRVGAGAIITINLKDFPDDILGEFDIFTRHPDDFILDLADLEPAVVVRAAKQ